MIDTKLITVDQNKDDWWSSLKHGGMLIAPSKLGIFPIDEWKVSNFATDILRRDINTFQSGIDQGISKLLDTVLELVLELSKNYWLKGNRVDDTWSYKSLITGEKIKPNRVWLTPQGGCLPVFVNKDTGVKRLGIGKGKHYVARVIEWLRRSNQKIALLTNGQQWRLIHAGSDYDAWCEWDIDFWFREGQLGQQVKALVLLLGRRSINPLNSNTDCLLLSAIASSRQGQAELSDVLGERVRKAVEFLIKECLRQNTVPQDANHYRHIYVAATRIIMRCVVILFAESRDLLPRDNPIYYDSYGIQGLWEQLNRLAGGRAKERLREHFSAWPRLLSLFRLVYLGSYHEALPVPRYGGGLFTPANSKSEDSILQALTYFEDTENCPSDAIVYDILKNLYQTEIKIRQGKQNKIVSVPINFSDLSSEYIGILYEGLLDFELRHVAEDDPIIFLNLGDQPALPLVRLEKMTDQNLENLVEKLKKSNQKIGSDEGDGEVEEDESDIDLVEEDDIEDIANTEEDELLTQTDINNELRERANNWAIRAVKAGKLVSKPKSKKPDALANYERDVQNVAKNLILRIVLPGDWFLVRWGGTRKGSGTFYTRRELATPTVRQTLLSLAYDPPVDENNQVNTHASFNEWLPKTPTEILGLKVCDPACGSGSFLVGALRFLTDALFVSLHHHGCIQAHGDRTLCQLASGKETNSMQVESLPVLPDAENFEDLLKARLKRYIVESCIYGVDLDALAIELARLSLWIETMDKQLPFSFIDHKVKCGNSLVGCWFDRFQDYPVMAWERDGGDVNHSKFVHHFQESVSKQGKVQKNGKKWDTLIKNVKNNIVKNELKDLLEALDPGKPRLQYPNFKLPALPTEIHDQAQRIFEKLHSLPIDYSDERENLYVSAFKENSAIQDLKFAFDSWCAVWFWPGDYLDIAPTPAKYFDPPAETRQIVENLVKRYKFFHWELEFPDVFATAKSGFSAILGNPPWNIEKPNSMEFFSDVDPLYRTYGKQEALNRQLELFQQHPNIEQEWLSYCECIKSLSNWTKNVGKPFGDPVEGEKFNISRSGKETDNLHELWRQKRIKRRGYTEPHHPFQYQGSADINTYKLFLEISEALLCQGGIMGMIVPSGIYTDKGTTDLRSHFLTNCQWHWLFGFENKEKIFDIHRSFKFCPIIIEKGGKTEVIQATFMQRSLQSWEEPEKYVLEYQRGRVEQFSPKSKSILEVTSDQDLQILEKIYANSVLLGNNSPQGWEINYGTEFHMTNDSKLFPPLVQWENKSYYPDEYGHWLKGNWQKYQNKGNILNRPDGLILSVDGNKAIDIDQVEDVALPLYEGRMIGQFDMSQKGWVSGTGRKAVWRDIPWDNKVIESQYLMSLEDCTANIELGIKIPIMDIGSSTNSRTMIGTIIKNFPCGHSLNYIRVAKPEKALILSSLINSIVFDYVLRGRVGGLHISLFILDEIAIISPNNKFKNFLSKSCASLSMISYLFATEWQYLKNKFEELNTKRIKELWAITAYERLRLRCILDAVIAELYGLEIDDFKWILRNCDHPSKQFSDTAWCRTLDPKGFWRVDKEKHPELRHTVLSLVAFHELKRIGIENFINLNDGEGWMLPETITLKDYDLGHDDRAEIPQPVASVLGERYLPWQLEGTVTESWEECAKHAENLRRLLKISTNLELKPEEEKPPNLPSEPDYQPPTDLFGNTLDVNLFGEILPDKSKSKRKSKR